MDKIDYTFKFSTELAVVSLSLFLVAVNIAGAHSLNSFNSSLFSKLLSYHPDRNLALYNKTTVVKTVVAQDNSTLFSSPIKVVLAAENFQNNSASGNVDSSTSNIDTSSADSNSSGSVDSNSIVNQNAIIKGDAAGTDQMIAAQIKVYVTQPGDTLNSVAAKFGVSTATIIWANNLPNNTIKPGWDLMILPVSGVLHRVTNNDTLPDIAKKYNADINQIISYNGLQDDSDTQPGQLLIIPGGTITPPPAPKPKPVKTIKNVINGKIVYEPIPDDITDYSGGSNHIFPAGQCTYYASKLRGGVPWGGNANAWLANAKAYGAKEGMTPKVGAIVVTNESRRYGHVAIVKEVVAGKFLVTEMNYQGRGVIDERWINDNSYVIRGFIY